MQRMLMILRKRELLKNPKKFHPCYKILNEVISQTIIFCDFYVSYISNQVDSREKNEILSLMSFDKALITDLFTQGILHTLFFPRDFVLAHIFFAIINFFSCFA